MTESREREAPTPSASLPPGAAAPSNGTGPTGERAEGGEHPSSSAPAASGEVPVGDPAAESPARTTQGDNPAPPPSEAPESPRDSDEDADEEDEDDDAEDEDEDDGEEDDEEDDTEGADVATGRGDAPSVAAAPSFDDEGVWASTARSVLLAGALGFGIATWVQLSIGARWANEMLANNVLPEGQRVLMIKASLGGAGLAVAIVGYLIWAGLRKAVAPERVERWLWFLSPLMLLPAAGWMFRYKPWVNEHARLLPLVLLAALVLEVLVFQSLKACPERVRTWFEELRTQVPEVVRRHGPLGIVVAGSLFYIGFFSFFLLRWHYKLKTGNFDLSINNNLMYGGLHGRFLESPVVFPQDPPKYLANHAKFGGYLFLPIYALFPKPQTLLVIQSTLIGLSALPLWGFARRHLSEWTATLVAVAYLLYYPMHGASFSEFQYVPIAGFFILTTVWAAETRRWVLFWLVFGAGILMREDMPIGMAVVGLFLLVSGHRPTQGLIMAAIAGAYFCILRFYVMEEAGQWWFPNMYKELWADGEKGFRSVIKTLLSNPLYVVSKIAVEKKIIYLLHLLVPLVFLPARRWYLWAAFIPGTVLTLLVTNYDPPITFSFHYVMHWTPYLFLAAILALRSIGEQPLFGPEHRRAAMAAMLGATLVLTYNYGAFPMRDGSFRGGFQKVDFGLSEAEIQRHDDLQTLIAMIPKDAPVAATEKLGPHVSSRVEMYTMRHGPQKAEYALASSRELKLSRTRPKLYEVLKSGEFGVMKRIGDLALLKRGYDTSGNERLIRDWRLADRPRQDVPRREPEAAPEPKEPEPEPEPEGRPAEPG